MPIEAEFRFRDNNGKRSTVTLLFADEGQGGTFALALDRCAAIAAAAVGLSDAYLERYRATKTYQTEGLPPASAQSSVYRRAALLFRDDGDTEGVWLTIPSYSPNLPVDADGPYAGRRITRENLVLSGMLGDIQDFVSGQLRPDGSPFPTYFRVGYTTGDVT